MENVDHSSLQTDLVPVHWKVNPHGSYNCDWVKGNRTVAEILDDVLERRYWSYMCATINTASGAVITCSNDNDFEDWRTYVIEPGDTVTASIQRAGIVSLILIAAVALIAAAVSALLPLLFGPSDAPDNSGGERQRSIRFRNSIGLGQPMGQAFGRYRFFPKLAAQQIQEQDVLPNVSQGDILNNNVFGENRTNENVGSDQRLSSLFALGYGDGQISEIQLGNTPLDNFENFIYFDYQSEAPPENSAFRQTRLSETIDIDISSPLGRNQVVVDRNTEPNSTAAVVNIFYPQGLFDTNKDGSIGGNASEHNISFRLAGSGDPFTVAVTDLITLATQNSFFRSFTINFPTPGEYEVRVSGGAITSVPNVGQTQYQSLTSVIPNNDRAVNIDGVHLFELTITTRNQVSGTLDDLNFIYEPFIRVRQGGVFQTPQVSRNPAWVILEIMTGAAAARPVQDSEIDLESFDAFAEWCDEVVGGGPRFTYDDVIDERLTAEQAITRITGSTRSKLINTGGLYRIVFDKPETVARGMFNEHNTISFTFTRAYPPEIDAYRITFIDENSDDFRDREITVFADGFNQSNAQKIERLTLHGCTRQEQAEREGAVRLAERALRPNRYSIQTDLDGQTLAVGDLIVGAFDTLAVGASSGRVIDIQRNGSNQVTQVTLDGGFVANNQTSYVLNLRVVTNTAPYRDIIQAIPIITNIADAALGVFTINNPVVMTNLKLGDLVTVGEAASNVVDMLVTSIKTDERHGTLLECVDAALNILDAETGEITVEVPVISRTIAGNIDTTPPPAPSVLQIVTDERALTRSNVGTLVANIQVTLNPIATNVGGAQPLLLDVQYRRILDAPNGQFDEWETVGQLSATTSRFTIPGVTEGDSFQIRLRHFSSAMIPSTSVLLDNVLVVGKTSPPSDPVSLVLSPLVTGANAQVPKVTDFDIAAIEFRFNRTDVASASPPVIADEAAYNAASLLAVVAITPSQQIQENDYIFPLIFPQAGNYQVACKFIDTGGRKSNLFVQDDLSLNIADQSVPLVSFNGDRFLSEFGSAGEVGDFWVDNQTGALIPKSTIEADNTELGDDIDLQAHNWLIGGDMVSPAVVVFPDVVLPAIRSGVELQWSVTPILDPVEPFNPVIQVEYSTSLDDVIFTPFTDAAQRSVQTFKTLRVQLTLSRPVGVTDGSVGVRAFNIALTRRDIVEGPITVQLTGPGPTTPVSILDVFTVVADNELAINPLSGSFPISAGSNRMLIVVVSGEGNDAEPSTVTYGGQSLTRRALADIQSAAPAFDSVTTIWTLGEAGIAAATDDVIIADTSPNQHNTSYIVQASSIENVNQFNPIISSDTDTATGVDDPSITNLPSQDGGYVIAAYASNNSETIVTWGNSMVKRSEFASGGSGFVSSVAVRLQNSADQTITLTTSDNPIRGILAAIAVRPVDFHVIAFNEPFITDPIVEFQLIAVSDPSIDVRQKLIGIDPASMSFNLVDFTSGANIGDSEVINVTYRATGV